MPLLLPIYFLLMIFFSSLRLIFARLLSLNGCLDKYMAWSGQKVNMEKSSVHFSKNFQGQAILSILDLLNLKKLPQKAKHLGLPLLFPRARVRAMEDVKDKFFQKISGWKAKVLSQTRWTVMIKAVASAIPSYLIGLYIMP